MADIQKAIRSVLANDATVSSLAGTRIYAANVPQAPTYPLVVFHLISEISHYHLGGAISCFAEARIQVDCYASTSIEASSLQDACRLALSMYQGTSQSVVIRRIYPGTGMTAYDDPEDGSDVGLWRHLRDYHAFYVEAA